MNDKPKTIVQEHQANFETMQRAFQDGQVCLMDCIEKSTGEHVAVICASTHDGAGFAITPFAKFFNGNPFELLSSPMEYEA
jgi:hypothetical protein